jgi:hypothetical protein
MTSRVHTPKKAVFIVFSTYNDIVYDVAVPYVNDCGLAGFTIGVHVPRESHATLNPATPLNVPVTTNGIFPVRGVTIKLNPLHIGFSN